MRNNSKASRSRSKQSNVQKEIFSDPAFEAGERDMALEVLQTGLMIGLIENQDRDVSLSLIRDKLSKDKEQVTSQIIV